MLARIPFWGWLVIITTTLYAVFNPLGISLFHMWVLTDPFALMPYNIMATLVVLVILGLVLHGTATSMSLLGFLVMLSLVGVGIWTVHSMVSFEILSLAFWSWASQPILALVLTVGWQWPKIWRRTTGAVSVNDPDTPA